VAGERVRRLAAARRASLALIGRAAVRALAGCRARVVRTIDGAIDAARPAGLARAVVAGEADLVRATARTWAIDGCIDVDVVVIRARCREAERSQQEQA